MTETCPPFWSDNIPRLQAALDSYGNTHAVDDVLDMLRASDAAFWIATPRSFVVAELINYPRRRVLNLALAGGVMSDMQQFEGQLVRFARQADCDETRIVGRPGWERALPGYRRAGVILRRTL